MNQSKSIDRTARRQFERENAKIFKEFATVCDQFEDALFAFDWEASEDLRSFPVFEKFNNVWIEFCQQWNKDKNHVALALPLSFYEYAIDQNLKTDTTTTTDRLDNDQKTVSNEKEKTGDNKGRPEGQDVQG